MKDRALIPVEGKAPKKIMSILRWFDEWATGKGEVYDKKGAKIRDATRQGYKLIFYDSNIPRNCVVELNDGTRLFLKKTMYRGDIEAYEKLSHRKLKICPSIFGYYKKRTRTLIVREFVEGEPIDNVDLEKLPKDELENFSRMLGKKLHSLHGAKITLPWDVEIIITPEGEPYFVDFDRAYGRFSTTSKVRDIKKMADRIIESNVSPRYLELFNKSYGGILTKKKD